MDSGAAALAHIAKDDYDVVLCDMVMPGMDGIATIKAIQETHPTLRLFLMTAHPNPETLFSSAGATGFIKMPLDRDIFLDLMRRTLAVISMGKQAASVWQRASERYGQALQHCEQIALLLNSKKSQRN